jgi:epoxyqueuosine reductase
LRTNLDDPSPLVRAMAVWALKRLVPSDAAELREHRLTRESDASVRAEWAAT